MLDYYRFRQALDLCAEGDLAQARQILGELQQDYVELCDENAFLKTQLEEYEDILYLAKNLKFDGEFFWLMTGAVRQGPFCPSCYNENGLLYRLQEHGGRLKCFTCGEDFRHLASPPIQEDPRPEAISPKVIQLYK